MNIQAGLKALIAAMVVIVGGCATNPQPREAATGAQRSSEATVGRVARSLEAGFDSARQAVPRIEATTDHGAREARLQLEAWPVQRVAADLCHLRTWGIGAGAEVRPGGPAVVSWVAPDGPAAGAGLMPGDRIRRARGPEGGGNWYAGTPRLPAYSTVPGPWQLEVQRGPRRLALAVTPERGCFIPVHLSAVVGDRLLATPGGVEIGSGIEARATDPDARRYAIAFGLAYAVTLGHEYLLSPNILTRETRIALFLALPGVEFVEAGRRLAFPDSADETKVRFADALTLALMARTGGLPADPVALAQSVLGPGRSGLVRQVVEGDDPTLQHTLGAGRLAALREVHARMVTAALDGSLEARIAEKAATLSEKRARWARRNGGSAASAVADPL